MTDIDLNLVRRWINIPLTEGSFDKDQEQFGITWADIAN